MMFRTLIVLFASAAFISSTAYAARHELSGTWKFSKSEAYDGDAGVKPVPEYPLLQIVNGSMFLQPRCEFKVTYTKKNYSYNDLFQAALRSGTDEVAMEKFVQRQFGVALSGAEHYYEGTTVKPKCLHEHRRVFLLNDTLFLVNGYGIFDRYNRVTAPKAENSVVNVYGRKFSELPYRNDVFHQLCAPLISFKKGMPQPTDDCGPVLFPYAVSKSDADPLAKLIGEHSYSKLDNNIQKDYDNPVSNGMHLIFMVFTPLNNVLVVAVEDIQQGEAANQTGMAGVYLSIKDGKVIDQISAGCDLRSDYSCVDIHGKKVFHLSGSGKFQKADK